MLLRSWLGVPILNSKAAGSKCCPLCESPIDIFGDHAVSYNRNGPWVRHKAVQESLHGTLISNGIKCILEVAIGVRTGWRTYGCHPSRKQGPSQWT